MTKQEYEAAIQSLDMELYASWLPDEGEKIAEKRRELKEQYIDSLEAEVAKLNRALDVAAAELERQSLDCPRNVYPEFDNNCCIGFPTRNEATCWREYALAEALKLKGDE